MVHYRCCLLTLILRTCTDTLSLDIFKNNVNNYGLYILHLLSDLQMEHI